MNKNFSYFMPTKIVFKENSLDDITAFIKGRKTVLITSEGFVKRGLVDRVKSLSKNIVAVVTDVKSHPEFKDLKIIYDRINGIDHDLILAIGGGSVLDAAKLFAVKNDLKDYSIVEDMIKGKRPKKGYSLTPIVSMPTTAGTGSEITPWATIWDMDEKKKYSLHLPDLFSEVAIYDPTLTISVPKDITIQTGLDALSHSLESIWNKNASPVTISYAIKAAKLIVNNLAKLSHDLKNLEYRSNIMQACMYAGLAFSNTQTAIAHGMSYYITAHKGIDHGIACSFTLPLLIDNIKGKYSFIDDALTEIFGELSSIKLRKLFKDLDISTEFDDYGIDNEELKNLKDSLTNNQRSGNSLVEI